MEEFKLGPNGGMIYCIEFLLKNRDWLKEQIWDLHRKVGTKYFVFDLPGQVEIYTNHHALRDTLAALVKELPMQFSALHLVDVSYLYDRHRFLSALSLSLTATIELELPFINAISKIDLLGKLGRPEMGLSFYQSISGLKYSFGFDDDDANNPFAKKYGKLSRELCDVVERYNLVSYTMIDITNKLLMANVVMQMDSQNGYFYDP
jgi:hypothetical protein